MDAAGWDERYSAKELVWSVGPNRFVTELVGPLTPGRALDVACGEGRNALWLAREGWQVQASDFSPVAIERVRELATELPADAHLVASVADATEPHNSQFDLVLFSYLHLAPDAWAKALTNGANAVADGGRLLVIGHAVSNLDHGFGGPQDPAVLHDPVEVGEALRKLGFTVERAEVVQREVTTDEGPRVALDSVVLARR